MASKNDILTQASLEYEAAKRKGDKAGMVAAHAKADRARGAYTKTVVKNGRYVQQQLGTMGANAASGKLLEQTRQLNATKLPTAPKNSFQSVLNEYNTSLPGVGTQVARNLPTAQKQEIISGTNRFFAQAPSQAGFMQNFALNNPKNTLENKLGFGYKLGTPSQINMPVSGTTQIKTAEETLPYKVGSAAGTMAQFAVPYAGASGTIGKLTAKALPSAGKLGQGIAKSVATDLAVGLPLNVNYAYNKEGLEGTDALKSIAANTGIDLVTGGLIEAAPAVLKGLKAEKVPVLVDGKVKYVDAPVSLPKANVSAPTPRTVASVVKDAPVEVGISKMETAANNMPVENAQLMADKIYYRGTNPGETKRISTGNETWDNNLFVTTGENHAKNYGSSIEKLGVKNGAKIIVEGDKDFKRIFGKPKKDQKLLDYYSAGIAKAKQEGIDIVEFARQGDTGTVVINQDSVVRNIGKPQTLPKASNSPVQPRNITSDKIISSLESNGKTAEPFPYNKYGDKINENGKQYASYKVKTNNGEYVVQLQGYGAGGYGNRIEVRISEPDFWQNGSIASDTFSNSDDAIKYVNDAIDSIDGAPQKVENLAVQPQNPEKGIEIPKEQAFAENGGLPKRDEMYKKALMKTAIDEYDRTVVSIADYISNYKPKGVDVGVIAKNGDELMRDGGIRYAASKNDEWYQDFYKANGRKPNKSEIRGLAESLVKDSLRTGRHEFYNPNLGRLIDEINGTTKYKDLGADTNKFKSPRKVSKVYSNTYQNSDMFTQAEKDAMNPRDYEYDSVSEKQSIAEAKQRLEADFYGEVNDLDNKAHFDGVDTDTAMGILEQYKQEARETGDWSKVNAWSKKIQERGTEGGQLVQAFAKYTRTPEGAVVKGQQTVAKVERDIKKKNPNLMDKVDKETKEVADVIKKAQKETADDLGDTLEKAVKNRYGKPTFTTTEEAVAKITEPNLDEIIGKYTADSVGKLASKVGGAVTGKKPIAPLQQAFNDLTSELYAIAKDTLPKSKIEKREISATDILKSAIDNKQNYREVWEKAKLSLYQKYADNPEAMAMLDGFFKKQAIPDFSSKTVTAALDQAVKELGVDIKNMILNSPNDKAVTLNNIKRYIMDKTGATGSEASALMRQIEDKYVEIVNGKNWSMLENLIKERVAKAPPSEFTKIKQLMNMGAYYSERYGKATGSATVKAINKTAKDFSTDLWQIIKQNAGDKQKLLTDIQNYVLYNTGLKGKDAEILARQIAEEYDTILKTKTESALKQMFPEAYGKTLKKAGQKSDLEKVMELINMGAYDNAAIRDVIKAKNKLPVLDDSDIKAIVENMELSAKQEDPYMEKMYRARAEQIISDKIPATFREKFRAMQRLSMIFNTKTLLTKNPFGNVLLGTAENLKDAPGTLIDMATTAARNKMREGKGLEKVSRTTAFAPIAKGKAQIEGFAQGLNEWRKDIKYGVDTSPSRGQFELPSGRVFKNEVLNTLDQIERKVLQLGDRPFYQSAYNSRIAELKKLGRVGEEAELDARLYALDRVFQNNSELSKRAVEIRRQLGLPGDLLMPFTQTPANILDKLIDYSPAGLGKAVYQLGKEAGTGAFNQKKFVDTLARTFTGGGIALLTYAMFDKGILSASLSENTDVRQAEQLQGKQAYSIKINGKWYSYDWAQPIAGIMAATADAIKAGAEKDDIAEALSAGGTSAIDSVFNQSFLSGLLTAFSGYSPAAGIGKALLGSTSQATPTAGAQIAKTFDTYERETYDPNRFIEQGNKLAARIPLARNMLPVKYGADGKPIMTNQGRNLPSRIRENFFYPFRVSQETNDPVNAELMRLQSETGDNSVLLNKTPKSFTKDGTPYLFTAKEYIEYQKTTGETAYKNIEKLLASPEYKNMDDLEKAKAIKDIHNDAIEQARVEYFKSKGVPITKLLAKSQQETYDKIKYTGITPETYYKLVRTSDKDGNGSVDNHERNITMRELGITNEQRIALKRASKK